jgi:hypothetical protein
MTTPELLLLMLICIHNSIQCLVNRYRINCRQCNHITDKQKINTIASGPTKLKLNSVALVRKRTIPTDRLPHVGEVSTNFLRIEGVAWSMQRISTTVNLDVLVPEPLLFHSVSSSVTSRGWVNPIPPLLRKSGSVGNRTRHLWICSQHLWPLYHRGYSSYLYIHTYIPCLTNWLYSPLWALASCINSPNAHVWK